MFRRLRILTPGLVVIGVLLLWFHGCSITLPPAAIDQITVTHDMDTVATITDPKGIADITAFVSAHASRGWHGEHMGTFPTPWYSVHFSSAGNHQYAIWISVPGRDWIGFRAAGGDAGDNVLRNISHSDHLELLNLLGISTQPPSDTEPTIPTSTIPAMRR